MNQQAIGADGQLAPTAQLQFKPGATPQDPMNFNGER
jgi:hypothetical protein